MRNQDLEPLIMRLLRCRVNCRELLYLFLEISVLNTESRAFSLYSHELVRVFLDLSNQSSDLSHEINGGQSICILCHGRRSVVEDEFSRPHGGRQIVDSRFLQLNFLWD